MADRLVERDDVTTALLRPLRPDEDEFIDDLCMQASSKLRVKLPTVDRRIALWDADAPVPVPGALAPESVSAVLAGVIARKLNNPRGLWSSSDSQGPSSHSETYQGGRSTGDVQVPGLTVTDADLRELETERVSVPRSMRLSRPGYSQTPVWPGSPGYRYRPPDGWY